MAVRAKMYVSELKRNAYDPYAVTVTMQVVSRGEANKEWAAATPSGTFTATIKNPAAAMPFINGLGDEFYVTIEAVPENERTPD